MIAITSVLDFYQKIREEYRSIVVYTSDGCVACKRLKEWLDNQPASTPVFVVDVKQENLYSIVNVSTLPTLELYEYTRVKDTVEGFQPERIQRWIKN